MYHFVMALVGCIGYVGNLGIIFAAVVLITCVLQLIAMIIVQGEAKCLQGNLNFKFLKGKGSGGNATPDANVYGGGGNATPDSNVHGGGGGQQYAAQAKV